MWVFNTFAGRCLIIIYAFNLKRVIGVWFENQIKLVAGVVLYLLIFNKSIKMIPITRYDMFQCINVRSVVNNWNKNTYIILTTIPKYIICNRYLIILASQYLHIILKTNEGLGVFINFKVRRLQSDWRDIYKERFNIYAVVLNHFSIRSYIQRLYCYVGCLVSFFMIK